jgi:hypothetical protein
MERASVVHAPTGKARMARTLLPEILFLSLL